MNQQNQTAYEIVDTKASLIDGAGIPKVAPEEAKQLSASQKRLRTFSQLNEGIPTNEFGLPEYIYRADLIPAEFETLTAEEKEKTLAAASVDLLYREGYPTLSDGKAFWSQLEYEPDDFYHAFQVYTAMAAQKGFRRLELLEEEPSITLPQQKLSEAFTYFYWADRCRAYDLFKIAAYHKEREARILSTNNTHYLKAEQLLGHLEKYFGEIDETSGLPAWLLEMTPGVAITALEKLTKIQRVSLDMPAHGPGTQAEGGGLPANSPLEVVLRTLVQRSQGDPSSAGSGRQADLDMLTSNPDAARLAQELVIKVGRGNNPNNSASGNGRNTNTNAGDSDDGR